MHVATLQVNGIRSFGHADLQLHPSINVFVGPNNAGKSTLLRAMLGFQYAPHFDIRSDLRAPLGSGRDLIVMSCVGSVTTTAQVAVTDMTLTWTGKESIVRSRNGQPLALPGAAFQTEAPDNAIYPYLSRRKAVMYSENVNAADTRAVRTNQENLYAKLDNISNSRRPANVEFSRACEDILGLQITSVPSEHGKRPAYVIDNFRDIPVTAMGEGVINILGLLADLFIAEGKIFIIEEIENDIHPMALKRLLREIQQSATRNQFMISTHSNIVVRHLCGVRNSKLFKVTMSLDGGIPNSTVSEVSSSTSERRAILEELGYDFADFDLHSAWLFLEESSAERIIRDHLIPWFAPKLSGRLRTFSTGGLTSVGAKFSDFDHLFVFANLESAYINRAWVIVDAGDREAKVISELRTKWASSGWDEKQFQQFSEHDFERYYPERFRESVDAACGSSNPDRKREAKRILLGEVLEWIRSSEEDAKREFADSADDVIARLRLIEQSVSPQWD